MNRIFSSGFFSGHQWELPLGNQFMKGNFPAGHLADDRKVFTYDQLIHIQYV